MKMEAKSVELPKLQIKYIDRHIGSDCCGGSMPCNHQWSPHSVIKSWSLLGYERVSRPHELIDKRKVILFSDHATDLIDVFHVLEFVESLLLPHILGTRSIKARLIAEIYDEITDQEYGEREVYLEPIQSPSGEERTYELGFSGTLDCSSIKVRFV